MKMVRCSISAVEDGMPINEPLILAIGMDRLREMITEMEIQATKANQRSPARYNVYMAFTKMARRESTSRTKSPSTTRSTLFTDSNWARHHQRETIDWV